MTSPDPTRPVAEISIAETPRTTAASRKMLAAWWHLIGFFLIVGWTLYSGWAAQRHAAQSPPLPSAQAARGQGATIKLWLLAAGADWLFLFYCWVGVRGAGNNLFKLIGGRSKNVREFFTDIAIAIPFWVVWEGVAYGVYAAIGSSDGKQVFPILPRSAGEALAWVLLSITAGVCEELIFRGYLQRQLQAVTGSVVIAVIGQGVVFGAAHSYQGWKPVLVISILGILYGALAAWRRNLRVNMIAHAWSDVFEGWLKFFLFPIWFPH